jgi:hypothetical protein
MPNAA